MAKFNKDNPIHRTGAISFCQVILRNANEEKDKKYPSGLFPNSLLGSYTTQNIADSLKIEIDDIKEEIEMANRNNGVIMLSLSYFKEYDYSSARRRIEDHRELLNSLKYFVDDSVADMKNGLARLK